MSLPDAKALLKLAKACRAAGIVSFEGEGIKFTLSEQAPENRRKSRAKAVTVSPADLGPNEVESDDLSPEALLFWSTGDEAAQAETS